MQLQKIGIAGIWLVLYNQKSFFLALPDNKKRRNLPSAVRKRLGFASGLCYFQRLMKDF
jgi:hypothetical protein